MARQKYLICAIQKTIILRKEKNTSSIAKADISVVACELRGLLK
jgi:hypothetical protein